MQKPPTITNEEAKSLMAWMSVKDRTITKIMIESGLRITDVLNLRIEDINHVMRVIESKTKKVKEFELDYYTLLWMKEISAGRKRGYIFTSDSRNKRIDRSTYYRHLKAISSRVGIGVSPHSFRKLYAQNKWLKTKNIYKVQSLMNHKYIETTARYLDIDVEALILGNLGKA